MVPDSFYITGFSSEAQIDEQDQKLDVSTLALSCAQAVESKVHALLRTERAEGQLRRY